MTTMSSLTKRFSSEELKFTVKSFQTWPLWGQSNIKNGFTFCGSNWGNKFGPVCPSAVCHLAPSWLKSVRCMDTSFGFWKNLVQIIWNLQFNNIQARRCVRTHWRVDMPSCDMPSLSVYLPWWGQMPLWHNVPWCQMSWQNVSFCTIHTGHNIRKSAWIPWPLTSYLDLSTYLRYYQGQSSCQILWPQVVLFSQKSADRHTDSQTNRWNRFYDLNLWRWREWCSFVCFVLFMIMSAIIMYGYKLTQDVSKCEKILEMKKNRFFSFFVHKQVNYLSYSPSERSRTFFNFSHFLIPMDSLVTGADILS